MSINLIIISRNSGAESYVNNIKSYNITDEANTHVVYPSSSETEASLVAPLLNSGVPNLVIYDWSTTLVSDISSTINDILLKTFDIVYLGKYLDTCNKYSPDSTVSNITMVVGTDPVGFNAVLMTGDFAAKLKTELETNTYYSVIYAIQTININSPINALATAPNLFTYNPMYNTIDSSQSYSAKTEECQPITSQITPPSDNQLEVFWIILIIILVALLLWLLTGFTKFGINSKAFMMKPAPPLGGWGIFPI
jgi:hypothetical protein